MAQQGPPPIRTVAAGRTKGIKLLVYGPWGAGKTRLAGSSPRALILRPPTDNTDSIDSGDAKEWVIHDWDEMWEAFEFLRHGGSDEYDWVWLDSISLWQDIGLDDIWQTVLAEKPHRGRYGLDKAEYGINMFRLARWTRHMAGMATDGLFNFGITAHPADLPIEDTDDAPEKLMPYIQGKGMASKVCGYMNVVGYLKRTKKGTPTLYVKESEDWQAKDQFNAIPDPMLNPTVPKIVAAIETSRPKPRKGTTTRRATRQKGRSQK